MNSLVDDRPVKRRKIEDHDSPSKSRAVPRGNQEIPKEERQAIKNRYKRANWAVAFSVHSEKSPSLESEPKTLPPLPDTSWYATKHEEPPQGRVRTSCRVRANVAVPNVPDSLQQPSKVPVLESKKPIDYFPWVGKHPEDVINETNVKQGYWDRPPHPLERELNTARAPLHNALKHRSGLENLSTLFSIVLDQKSRHGALSTSSTFRPPPRVTLTEAKRKSWISDLADESVPLRRLSRTIPQGIRGTVLLEQCLIHDVPINRAMWFVKCVGANEIRTLRRKGANPTVVISAEGKWLRDWTMNIEQFLESTVARCGSENWLENLRYSLQLCTRLYHENLLDGDHFLDWLVKSFSNTSLETLAVWLPLVQMWRLDLIRFRKRAKSLALAFLAKFQELTALGATNGLRERLRRVIQSLAVFRPACFVIPDRWNEHRETLQACLNLASDREADVFRHLDKRNDRLLGKDFCNNKIGTTTRSVFKILDDSTAPFDVKQISQDLIDSCADHDELSNICLQWATSKFRGGVSRIYLVARLLRRWLRNGLDVGNRILNFFTCNHDSRLVDSDSYRHLFAELSRSQSFSSSRFLQNLTLRGARERDAATGQDKLPSVLEGHLLQDLSLLDAEEHLVNLKNYLLQGIGKNVSANDEQVRMIKSSLARALNEAEDESSAATMEHIQQLTSEKLDWSARFEIGQWLRGEVGHLAQRTMTEIPGKPPLPGSRAFRLNQFLVIRDVLEIFGDIAILADVLSILSQTTQEDILAAMVDTVHCNAAALSAIGALEPLQKIYGQAYVTLRAMRPSLLLFATSLADLCQSFPCAITPVRALQQDLMRGDRGRAMAACSPFSDGIAESLQQAGATFVDDFEAILQGEPNMGEQTMTSLFQVLVRRIMKSDSESLNQNTSALCQLLARLRLFKPSHGDLLIKQWISKVFTVSWSAAHQSIILELVFARCISIEALLNLCDQASPTSSCKSAVTDLIVNSLLQPASWEFRQQIYVVRTAARRMLFSSPARILELLLARGAVTSRLITVCAVILPGLLDNKSKLSTLSALATKRLSSVINEFLGIANGTTDVLSKVLSLSTWLSLPFCRYRLSSQSPIEGSELYESDGNGSSLVVLRVLETRLADGEIDGEVTQALIDALPIEVSAQIRALMEQQFYDSMPKCFPTKNFSQPHQATDDKARATQIVERLISLGPAKSANATTDTNGILIEKLTIIHKILGAKGDIISGATAPLTTSSPTSPGPAGGFLLSPVEQRQRENVLSVFDCMELITRVASMKAGSFGALANSLNSASAKQTQTEQIKILALLASIATQPVLTQLLYSDIEAQQKQRIRDCMGLTLDVAARMADDLSDEARSQCAKILKEKMRDERVAWLVGSMSICASFQNAAGQGLAVMHEIKGYLGEFRPKQWEMLESGGGKEGDTCLGLGLFGAKRL